MSKQKKYVSAVEFGEKSREVSIKGITTEEAQKIETIGLDPVELMEKMAVEMCITKLSTQQINRFGSYVEEAGIDIYVRQSRKAHNGVDFLMPVDHVHGITLACYTPKDIKKLQSLAAIGQQKLM